MNLKKSFIEPILTPIKRFLGEDLSFKQRFFVLDLVGGLLCTVVILVWLHLAGLMEGSILLHIIGVFIPATLIIFLLHYFWPLIFNAEKKRIYQSIHSLSVALHEAKTTEIKDRSSRIMSAIEKVMMHMTAPTPEIEEMEMVDVSLFEANRNLCAVSSKNINLWEDSTFLYYFIQNAARTLDRTTEASRPPLRFALSTLDQQGPDFEREEQAILKDLASKKVPNKFFTLRFLFYSAEEYKGHFHLVRPLIKAHWMLGMHCVPLLIDGLKHLQSAEREFIKTICSELNMTDLEFPDILVVDVGATINKDVKPHPILWYYTNVGPQHQEEGTVLRDSIESIFILAKLAYEHSDSWWPGYSLKARCRLGVNVISDCASDPKCPL